jgi:hypothetical protein
MKAFLKTLQRLKQEWQKSPALGPGKQMEKKLGLIWRNREKISQTINYLPFFLLIILWCRPCAVERPVRG